MFTAAAGRYKAQHVLKTHRIVPPLEDRYNLIYIAMVVAGAGFLLPYNSLISAVDFYKTVFPGSSIMFDISLVYILTSLLAVLLNNVLIEAFTLNFRIKFGYFVSIFTLGLVLLLSFFARILSTEGLYALTLTAVAVISLGATVQQSSFYGFTSMLPNRYTQAVMTGESLAGVLASTNRILTKILVGGERESTAIFFLLSLIILVLCLLIFPWVQRSSFVCFYTSLATTRRGEGTHQVPSEEKTILGSDIQISQNYVEDDTEEFRIPEFSSSCRNGASLRTRAEDVLVEFEGGSKKIGGNIFECFRRLRAGLRVRLAVCRKIVPHMAAIFLTYTVTLALFPGIESEIESCSLGQWMPVLLIAAFNISDLIGKMVASLSHCWSRGELVLWSLSRILLLPLLIMCVAPRHKPVFRGELAPLFLTTLLGLSNGLWGSLPMILAPAAVPEHQREHTGNLMTIAYSCGLTFGSLFSYWLDSLVGNTQGPPCPRLSAHVALTPRNMSTFYGLNI